MKKNDLFKILGFLFFVVIVLTWIIPVGSFENGSFSLGSREPLGLFDIGRVSLITFINLIQYGFVICIIGGLYGVINKTGAYSTLIEKIVSKFKGKEKIFLSIVIYLLAILSSLIGVNSLFILIAPFIIAILMRLGFNKKTVLASTFGAILIGNVASLYGSEIVYYIKTTFYLGINDNVFTKIILLAMLVFLLHIFVITKCELEENKEIPLYEKSDKKRKTLPLCIISIVFIGFIVLNMINWEGLFGINGLSNTYNKLMNTKVNNYPIVSNIFGSVNIFGKWNNYDLCIFVILMTSVYGFIYSLKLDDMIDGFKKGVKAVLKPAFYAIMASILFVCLYRIQSTSNIYFTITNWLLTLFSGAKIVMMPVVSFIGGFFYTDFAAISNSLSSVSEVLITDTTKYSLVAFMIQTMYGLSKIILPTSVLLVTGLSYLNISYKEWFKYIIKFVLCILVILILFFVIINFFL